MAAENFERVMEHIFQSEGGYVNHPRDPGGATNMGITIGTLRDYRGQDVTVADVKALTKEEAREIYRKNYWNVVAGDELPAGVDLCTMDGAVNSGPSRGVRWLQRACGATADGRMGPKTLAAVETVDAATIVARMCDDRLIFLKGLGTWRTFGTGWSRRVSSVRSAALSMAREDETAIPVPAPALAPEKGGWLPNTKYNKLIGSLIGALAGWAVSQGLIPDGAISQVQIDTVVTALGSILGTYLAPKNKNA